MSYESFTGGVIVICEVLLAICAVCSLIRAVIGPKTADRLVAVNMTGTQVICLVCLVTARSGEGGFADIAIIYALLSCLAAVVFTKIVTKRGQEK